MEQCYAAEPQAAEGEDIALADVGEDHDLVEPLTGMHGHATAVGDVDHDSWEDLFVGTFADRPPEDYHRRGADGPSPDRLLLGGPDGFVIDESFPESYGRTSGAAFADLDDDGDLDLAIARNPRSEERGDAPSVVLENRGGTFTEATVLDDTSAARSVGVLDFDGDGRLDIFLTVDRFGNGSGSRLLRNDGGLAFSEATDNAGIGDDVYGLGVTTADLSGDARPDIFVAGSNRLFVHDGDRGFLEVSTDVFDTETFGDEDDPAGVAAGDVNRDGLLDLVVGQHFNSTLDEGRRVPVRLYLNRGNDEDGIPEYREVTQESGLVGLPTKAPHVDIADLDADGWPDIVTSASAEDGSTPAIFRHTGLDDDVPRFEAPEGLGNAQYWVAGATFDADHDGVLDIFSVEWEPRLPSKLFRVTGGGGHWLGVTARPGSLVEVHSPTEPGSDTGELVGVLPVTASTGYGSGSSATTWFGLGDLEQAVVSVRPAWSEVPTTPTSVPADQLVALDPEVCPR